MQVSNIRLEMSTNTCIVSAQLITLNLFQERIGSFAGETTLNIQSVIGDKAHNVFLSSEEESYFSIAGKLTLYWWH